MRRDSPRKRRSEYLRRLRENYCRGADGAELVGDESVGTFEAVIVVASPADFAGIFSFWPT